MPSKMCLWSPARSRPYPGANFKKCQAFVKGASDPTKMECAPVTQADTIRLHCMDMTGHDNGLSGKEEAGMVLPELALGFSLRFLSLKR